MSEKRLPTPEEFMKLLNQEVKHAMAGKQPVPEKIPQWIMRHFEIFHFKKKISIDEVERSVFDPKSIVHHEAANSVMSKMLQKEYFTPIVTKGEKEYEYESFFIAIKPQIIW